jgi:predicted MFS family arabinose efflux permease
MHWYVDVRDPQPILAAAAGHAAALLWVEAAAVLASGALAARVPAGVRTARPAAGPAPTIRAGLAGNPVVIRGWIIRGTGCFLWTSFTLGLTVLGVSSGHAGLYIGAAMTAYGIGSVASSILLIPRAYRFPTIPTAAAGWAVIGAAWLAMGLHPSLVVICVGSLVGAAAIVLSNACITQALLAATTGPARRAALSGQAVTVGAASAAGSLASGPLVATVGGHLALIVAGLLTTVVAVTFATPRRAARDARDGESRSL